MENNVIKQFLNDGKITQDEYDILFEDKSSWYTEDENGFKNWNNSQRKIEKFNLSLKSFIALQSNQDRYNFYYIHFPLFDIKKLFSIITLKDDFTFLGCVFYGEIDFRNFIFEKEFYLEGCTFFDDCIFYDAVFKQKFTLSDCIFFGYINFIYSHFIDTSYFALLTCFKDVDFGENTFEKKCFLHYSDFYGNLSFEGSVFKKNSLIKDINFLNINLIDAEFNNLSLLGLNSLNQINISEIINNKISTKLEPISSPISQKNFTNKESARLIKDHFEKQNNITEANKYFVIEQEKYIEELKDKENKTEGSKWVKLIPLYLNKYVSNFGTDWIRAILALFVWAVAMNLSYGIINKDYVSVFNLNLSLWDTIGTYFNTLTKMINPINAFKDESTFTNHEFFGAIVRVVSATIIYQIIVAFRQFTRRG